MAASRHHQRTAAPVAGGPTKADDDFSDPLRWIWLALISGLFFMRWWQPTEGTILGDTLWIAAGWFVALALAAWVGIRGTKWKVRFDGWQWAVALLVGGHVLSGLIVVCSSGDRRAAINLIWEWIAIGVSFPLLRSALSRPETRREWTVMALAAALTLGGYGLTQRYLFYPQMVAEYERLRQELDTLEDAAQNGGAVNLPRMQKVRGELLGSGLPSNILGGSGRALFEGRLKHSTEALGTFALANTFAGLLLVWWSVLLVLTLRQWMGERMVEGSPNPALTRGRIWRAVALTIATVIVGYCLLLTKSRTGYAGAIVALTAWTLTNQSRGLGNVRRIVRWGILALLGAGGLTLLAGLTGGLDRLVLSEAPKSLQYRLEYWWGSLQVVRESPLVGVGPGQFRQHYLAHKLPRSSEEIADPHNLFLDVWANGGLLALAGLSWLVYLLVRQALGRSGAGQRAETASPSTSPPKVAIPLSATVRESGTPASPTQKIPQPPALNAVSSLAEVTDVKLGRWTSPFRWGAWAGLLALWVMAGGLETLPLILLIVWIMAIELIDVVLPAEPSLSLVWPAVGLGLLVHLCGAGGIAMPAISQLLLLIAVLAAETTSAKSTWIVATWQKWCLLVVGLALLVGGYVTAAQPVTYARWLCDQGEISSSITVRERSYRLATSVDPLNAEPWEKLAELNFQKWRLSRDPDDRDFQQAVLAQRNAKERNPYSYHTHQTLGLFFSERAKRTNNAEDKANAVKELQIAIRYYPQSAILLADAAAVFKLGDQVELAKLTARSALEQDDINRAAGHTDKWLSAEMRQQVEKQAKDP